MPSTVRRVEVPVPGEPLPPALLEAAVAAMAADGIVILGGAIPLAVHRALADKMTEDMLTLNVNDGDLDFGHGDEESVAAIGEEGQKGEAERRPKDFRGIRPPPFAPHLHREIVYNEAACQVSGAYLGPEPTLVTYATNSSFPGSQQQGVHADNPFPLDPTHVANRSPGLVLNIPIQDYSVENGATLTYPGSHLNTSPTVTMDELVGGTVIPPARLAEREACRPSEQPCPRRGDIVLRDLRLWRETKSHSISPACSIEFRPLRNPSHPVITSPPFFDH